MIIEQKREQIVIDYQGSGLTPGKTAPYFDSFVLKNDTSADRHPCIVVCPGGGYHFVSDREAEPIATQFVAAGFSAFILHYSVVPAKFPCALIELSALMKHIRENADNYQIDPNKIAVIGFSAGGHLAGSLGAYWNNADIQRKSSIQNDENRPNALILSYPVITGGEKAHRGSVRHLMGDDCTQEDIDTFSLEKHVTAAFPPTFLWHTAADASVPVENSLMMASALSAEKIPFELRIYPHGQHGLSLANEVSWEQNENLIIPRVQEWMGAAISFLKEVAFS